MNDSTSYDDLRSRLDEGTRQDTPPTPSDAAEPETLPEAAAYAPGDERRRPVAFASVPEPEPRRFIIEDLMPDGAITALIGDAGLGKSMVALFAALCICLGRPFLSRRVVQGPVIYVDRELDFEEQTRRAYALCRGLGLDEPPPTLRYLRPEYPFGADETDRLIRDAVREMEPIAIVADSFTLGSMGDMKEQRDTVNVLRRIESWGPAVLFIDHISKKDAAGNQSNAKPYGSVMKYAGFRSVVPISQAAGGAITLRQSKANFGEKAPAIHFTADFEPDAEGRKQVAYRVVGADDASMRGAEENAPADEQTHFALVDLYEASGAQPVPLELLSAERGQSDGTTRNHISSLRKKGLVIAHGDNTYSPILPPPDEDDAPDDEAHSPLTTPREVGTVNEAPPAAEPDRSPTHSPPLTGVNGTVNDDRAHSQPAHDASEKMASTTSNGHSPLTTPRGQGTVNETDEADAHDHSQARSQTGTAVSEPVNEDAESAHAHSQPAASESAERASMAPESHSPFTAPKGLGTVNGPLAEGIEVETPAGPGVVTDPPAEGKVSVEVDGMLISFPTDAVRPLT